MLNEAVVRKVFECASGACIDALLVELGEVLPAVIIAAEPRRPELAIMPANRRVGEERQQRSIFLSLVRSRQGGGVSRGHESGNPVYLASRVTRVFLKEERLAAERVDAHRQTAWQGEKIAARWQFDEILEGWFKVTTMGHTGHAQFREVEDVPRLVAIDQRGKRSGMGHLGRNTFVIESMAR
jgi:hypothetical protein